MTAVMRRGDDSFRLEAARLEMRSGEKLLWAGRPGALALARVETPKALIGIPFLAFSLFWIFMAGAGSGFSGEPGPVRYFPLFGLIFVAVGLAMVLAPVWGAIKARWTVYAISDRRLVILSSFPVRRVQSFATQDIQGLERTERGNGSGDIVFRREPAWGDRKSSPLKRIGFFGVEDVRTVEDTIRRMRAA
jgi:hypothetical protein